MNSFALLQKVIWQRFPGRFLCCFGGCYLKGLALVESNAVCYHCKLILCYFLYEHCSVGNWEIITIDKRRNKLETRRKETFLTT